MPLQIKDLKVGDILLVSDATSTATHAVISIGQLIANHSSGSSSTVHAAIYAGDGKLIESSGEGLLYGALTPKTKFIVYRYKGDSELLAEVAADCAYTYYVDHQKAKAERRPTITGSYTVLGAFLSLFRSSKVTPDVLKKQQDLWGKDVMDSCFCSNFVMRCYEAAAVACATESHINAHFKNTSPKQLQAQLMNEKDHWQHVGDIQTA